MRPVGPEGEPIEAPPPEGLEEFLQHVPLGGWAPDAGWENAEISGPGLLRRARAAAGKAADSGGWTAKALLCLPEEFWDEVAEVWNEFLQGAEMPPILAEVRTVGVPKEDGTDRPISVAALLWRLANGVLVERLTSWVEAWAPPELAGGLRGRSAADIHGSLIAAIQEAERAQSMFSAMKENVKKAFPSIWVGLACHILER